MITIGIELNNVVRNINRQVAKYYIKSRSLQTDISEVDDKEDIFSTFAEFDNPRQKAEFMYVEYPYEIFGCAQTMESGLSVKLNRMMAEAENVEEDEIRFVYFSMNEGGLSIPSTHFFLSKIGSRVRKVLFPTNPEEVFDECDVVITANNAFFSDEEVSKERCILIRRPFNKESDGKALMEYGELSEVTDDDTFFGKIIGKFRR